MHILQFSIQRIIQGIVVLTLISIGAFLIQHQLGDPLRELVGQSVSESEREALREEMGLNDSLPEQYWRFVKSLPAGGPDSYGYKEPALHVIGRKFQATAELVFVTSLIILLISIPVGIFCAIRPRNVFARTAMTLSIIGISVPVFLTAIFLIYYFAVEFNLLPSFGRGHDLVEIGRWNSGLFSLDGWRHLLLPSLALSSIMLPLFIRLIRSEMSEVITRDYIRTARAKGLRPARIWFIHALKNTLLPVISVGGVQLGTMLAFTILTESVFQWPGMGFTFLDAINRSDAPLITSFLLVIGLIFVVTNTLVDLLYGLVNPTVSISGSSS